MEFPKLRPVNLFPVRLSGETYLCLQDPQNVSERSIFLPVPFYFVISKFDGRHSVLDIQAEYMRKFGDFLFTDTLKGIISQLDENLFLEGERYEEALRRKEETFQKSPDREAAFAGKSYEQDPQRLRDQMQGYFSGPAGPGPLGPRATGEGLKAVVAPHIDFQRGGFSYAFAHREIWERNSSRCFIVLGTAHAPMPHPFCLTRKNYKTPLGILETDKKLVDAIQSRCPYDLFSNESIHRSEHSIEFQCLFLRFLMPDSYPWRIVPILCGSFHEAVEQGISPMEIAAVRQFIEALREAVSSVQEAVCYIASADLAHMGLQFGDREGIDGDGLERLGRQDREMLGFVERLDGEGFSRSIVEERDRRRICGFPSIYTLLKTVEAQSGKVLSYGQAPSSEAQSVVTFASMAFY